MRLMVAAGTTSKSAGRATEVARSSRARSAKSGWASPWQVVRVRSKACEWRDDWLKRRVIHPQLAGVP